MARMIAPGVEGPTHDLRVAAAMEAAAGYKKRRDDAKWYVMMGVAMLFAGSVSSYIAAGGAAMCLWGLATYGYWSLRMKGAYDPWKDQELDAWEDEQYHDDP